MSIKNRGLGKGLNALLSASQKSSEVSDQELNFSVTDFNSSLKLLDIETLVPGKYQPRQAMEENALEELACSIRSKGIIQPIVVRLLDKLSDSYEIIAGERRWQASQLAGLDKVPCIIKEISDEDAGAMSLIENIQRENLNAMEESIALKRLTNDFSLTHQQVAEVVGKSRATISNLLRLDYLTEDVKLLLLSSDIEMGHARALLSLKEEQQIKAATEVVRKKYTVRETERLVQRILKPKSKLKKLEKDADISKLERYLCDTLKTKVEINTQSLDKGKLVIAYSSLDELDHLLSYFKP